MAKVAKVGLVIRATGQVPIDADHPYRAEIIAALRAEGHVLLHADGCDHHQGGACSCSPTIQGWASKQ